ncbi:restriction endonuclease subunit S [Pseudoalteromonas arctica]|uniref:Type I restriction modification DNA specificity domain-containing protein n=1 Tax=Pseudoalteromonas arctica TaxID=394751 RepID=A0A7Y0DT38_9GAMM|nr:restriction endonuclease subunit S [Pseudoalteromonas arctica]NMM40953.1 hypothetical protein [Pseudoalteromonas arctica]
MVELKDIFDVQYGHSLELNRLEECESNEGVAFISRKSGDNGVAAYVKELSKVTPAPAGELTCALSGNGVLSTFIQEREFYTGYHIARLKPKVKLTRLELLYYSLCISTNRYKYSWGRQANRTIKQILIPSVNEIPDWVNKRKEKVSFNDSSNPLITNSNLNLDTINWKEFRYDEIFNIKKGYYNKKPPVSGKANDTLPFIGATEKNNGITSYIKKVDIGTFDKTGKKTSLSFEGRIFEGNCITVTNNGSVGEAFYQETQFTCSHDVNPLYLKDPSTVLNKYIAMFIISLIKMEKYRWGYGRKWRPLRMPSSIIKLPVVNDKPDWNYMEKYIKSVNFSSSI